MEQRAFQIFYLLEVAYVCIITVMSIHTVLWDVRDNTFDFAILLIPGGFNGL